MRLLPGNSQRYPRGCGRGAVPPRCGQGAAARDHVRRDDGSAARFRRARFSARNRGRAGVGSMASPHSRRHRPVRERSALPRQSCARRLAARHRCARRQTARQRAARRPTRRFHTAEGDRHGQGTATRQPRDQEAEEGQDQGDRGGAEPQGRGLAAGFRAGEEEIGQAGLLRLSRLRERPTRPGRCEASSRARRVRALTTRGFPLQFSTIPLLRQPAPQPSPARAGSSHMADCVG